MPQAIQFLAYWALAFVTLCVALVALHAFYRLVDSDLHLHAWPKEVVVATVASFFQGAGFWASALLFHGDAFRRPVLLIPFTISGLVYWMTHLNDWSGYEIGGIALFQAVLAGLFLCMYSAQYKLAVLIAGGFAICLMAITGIVRKL